MNTFQIIAPVFFICVAVSVTVFINLLSYDFYLDLKAKKKKLEEAKKI